MLYDIFIKDTKLRNSIVLAKTLSDLFSNPEEFKRFKDEMIKYKGNHSMQKFTWNKELDKHSRLLTEEQLENMCTQSDKLKLVGRVKDRYKIVNYVVHTDVSLTYESRDYTKQRRHIYADSVKSIEVQAGSTFEIHKFDLLKILLDSEYLGIMSNAKIKIPNTDFPNGIETPFDIFNKCTLQLSDG